jgi:peptidoglycan/LPS O-acetylase OafA/YrhL
MHSTFSKIFKRVLDWFDLKIFHKTSSSNIQIDALDGIRGLAIIFVLLSHFNNYDFRLIPGFSFSGIGKAGVYLFFVLSSFLLTSSFLIKPAHDLKRVQTYKIYFIRRFFRIFPLFTLILIISLFFSQVLHTSFSFYQITLSNFLNHVLLQQGNSVLWSIPVEFKYYFVLPLVVIIFYLLLKKRTVPAIAFSTCIIILTMIIFPPEGSLENDVSLIYYLPIFLCGSLGALLHYNFQKSLLKDKIEMKIFCEGIAVISSLLVLTTIPNLYSIIIGSIVSRTYFSKYFLMYGIIWTIFILGVLNGEGKLKTLFSQKILRLIGICSFSIYLWHSLVMDFFINILNQNRTYLISFIIVLAIFAISIFSYIYIEKPFLSYGVKNKLP